MTYARYQPFFPHKHIWLFSSSIPIHVQLFSNYLVANPHMAVCQNLVPLVNIKIAGKWMFIPLKMVLIGIDPYPYHHKPMGHQRRSMGTSHQNPRVVLVKSPSSYGLSYRKNV